MKLKKYIKLSLIIIFLFGGLLLTHTICYAANGDENNSTNIPSCSYTLPKETSGMSSSYNITIVYYQNKLSFSNNGKYSESVKLSSSYTAKLNDEAKGALKSSNVSFSCPTSVNISIVDNLGASKKYSFSLTSDNSIVESVVDGKNTNGNKLEQCSQNHLNNLKNELNTNFTNEFFNPIYKKLNQIKNIEKTYSNERGQTLITDISYVESQITEATNLYSALLNGIYGSKKQEIIEKYRKYCTFSEDSEALTYVKKREEELLSSIKYVGSDSKSKVRKWMVENGVDIETITEQENSFNKNTTNNLKQASSVQQASDNAISKLIDDIKDNQKILPANCGIFSEIMPYLELIFKWIRILVPIALICFGVIDFTVPILSGDKDALNKATSKFIKRCIIAIIVFFVPTIVEILLNIYNESTGADASTCGLSEKIITSFWR